MKQTPFFLLLLTIVIVSCEEKPASADENVAAVSAEIKSRQEQVESNLSSASEIKENELNEKMFSDFLSFRKVVLSGSCEDLINFCDLPLQGNCGGILLGLSEDDQEQSITEKELLENCTFLDSIELSVLKKRISIDAKTDVDDKSCIYNDHFNVSSDGKEFIWSVGCVHLIDEEIGEYTRSFTFHKVNGHFRLYKINCAG